MSFLLGPMKKHIEGHKKLTTEKELITVIPDFVAIPLTHGGVNITPLVKEGDYVKIGDVIGVRDDKFYVPIFASVSGTVKGIEKKMSASLKPADHVVIENDHKDAKAEPKKLDANASKEQIIEFMKGIGLIGQGGANFPTYIKYSTDKCETLIVNAVECEPYISNDERMSINFPEYLKEGVRLAVVASNAKKVYICIKNSKKELYESLTKTFDGVANVEICKVEDIYPAGWERTCVKSVLNKTYDRLPIEVGAIVSNVSTLIQLARSAKEGYPIYEFITTVSGDAISEPHNVLTRVGTDIKTLVEACGGYTEEKICLVANGPMMGKSVTKEEVVVGPGCGAVTVLKYVEYEEVNCLRCSTCVDHCIQSLQPCNIVNAAKANDIERLIKLKADECQECGMCSYVCPSKIDVTELVRRAKKTVLANKKK